MGCSLFVCHCTKKNITDGNLRIQNGSRLEIIENVKKATEPATKLVDIPYFLLSAI